VSSFLRLAVRVPVGRVSRGCDAGRGRVRVLRYAAGTLVVTLVSTVLAGPWLAAGQTPPHPVRLGLLGPGPAPGEADVRLDAFRRMLRELGWVEGENLTLEARWAPDTPAGLPALADELTRLPVDVIVALTGPAARAARQATATIPILGVVGPDPEENRLLTGLARPGGNVTGVTRLGPPQTLALLELITELIPRPGRTGRVAVLRHTPIASPRLIDWREAQLAARAMRITLISVDVRGAQELEAAFAEITRQGARALIVSSHPEFVAQRSRIAELAAANKVPAVYELREFAEAGGLVSQGPGVVDLFRRAAAYADRILKGARAGDLPVEAPTRQELVINLTPAKALGLEIPGSLLIRADQLIE
jgi:putative tryptophan/tyrosine transport system substrate-binding protein